MHFQWFFFSAKRCSFQSEGLSFFNLSVHPTHLKEKQMIRLATRNNLSMRAQIAASTLRRIKDLLFVLPSKIVSNVNLVAISICPCVQRSRLRCLLIGDRFIEQRKAIDQV